MSLLILSLILTNQPKKDQGKGLDPEIVTETENDQGQEVGIGEDDRGVGIGGEGAGQETGPGIGIPGETEGVGLEIGGADPGIEEGTSQEIGQGIGEEALKMLVIAAVLAQVNRL